MLDRLHEVAEALDDDGAGGAGYVAAIEVQREAVEDPEATPSARILADMRATGESFFEHVRGIADRHHDYYLSLSIDPEREARLESLAAASLDEQRALEANDTLSFAEYLERHLGVA